MTDNDIVKALECCTADPAKCRQCPLDIIGTADCFHYLIQKHSLDIINRQKAEIEEQDQAILNALKHMKDIRIEAIKEFAERLKERKVYSTERHENIVPVAEIDWAVKEMKEETP